MKNGSLRKCAYAVVSAVVIAISALLFLGCDNKRSDVAPHVTVFGDTTTVEWDESADSYNLYRAPSKYGEYKVIASDLKKGEYTDAARFCWYRVGYVKDGVETMSGAFGEESELFGDNVYVFSPTDNPVNVKNIIDSLNNAQERAHFGKERYAFLFKPGTYDDRITLKTGYFMTYAGLGATPSDVSVYSLSSSAKWMNDGGGAGNNALINFWRGAENFQTRSDVLWAVSQGCYLRGVDINGTVRFHDAGGFASGGFFADSVVRGNAESGSQQQFFSRNVKWNGWTGGVWNMCAMGLEGAFPTGAVYTSVPVTPVVREKPYLVWDGEHGYRICVPALKRDSVGTDKAAPVYIEQAEIFFAKPTDGADKINDRISSGMHVVFTPGIYELDEAVYAQSGTVLLGLGMATLVPTSGNVCVVTDADDVTVAGILFDAGEKKSDCLLRVGDNVTDDAATPTLVADCFFRVGGAKDGVTDVDACMRIYANDVICDNIWLWRADHGDGVGWDVNRADYGLVVYGKNVSAYGLFSEHFKKHNVLWQGDGGAVVFYQSEIAYDVPSAAAWTQDDGTAGYQSFKVTDDANAFTAYALGIYSNFHNDGVTLANAMSVPDKAGVSVKNICTVALSQKGEITNVINNTGGAVNGSNSVSPRRVAEYKGGV